MRRKVLAVVGARPNFMKVAPIWREMEKKPHLSRFLVHTGQHYDANMSKIVFYDLRLPEPNVYLGVGSGSHGEQTGRIMIEFEKVLSSEGADLVLVVGDVNSTMAAALVAEKLQIPVAHVEAGLRSFDRTMPEEINRMVTDIVATLLFTTSPEAELNLLREGVGRHKIYFVGNVMIDSLFYYLPLAEGTTLIEDLGLKGKPYGLVTLHRPSNVDDIDTLRGIVDALVELGGDCPLVFPVHPRTRKAIEKNKIKIPPDRLRVLDPIGYLEFVKLMSESKLVLTDSGGIQEETTALGIPCLTVRDNTERPITVEMGTNRLVGGTGDRIVDEGRKALKQTAGKRRVPELWDGNAAQRIVQVIDEFLS